MSTPSPLSPVVGEAQASPKLTDVERAAMSTDFHATICHVPLGECVECMTVFRTARRIIVAVTPVIEEPLLAEVDRLRRIVDDVAALTRSTDGDLLHPDSELPVGEFQAVLYPDGAPVAAALDPTPIPDGEREVQ